MKLKFEEVQTPTGPAFRCEPYEIRHYEISVGSRGMCTPNPHYSAYVRIKENGKMLFGNYVGQGYREYKTLKKAIAACQAHYEIHRED